ncbi:MAG TPA: nuclear transport factor 2 family protein [Gemmatimonadales bacterium]|jgi:ketosteroid isomerase-like protein
MIDATVGSHTRYREILDEFGVGWMAGDAKRMAAVFTHDGVFAPDPFDAVLRGRAAIEAYWRDVPLNQSEIAFRVGEVFTVGPWFAAEFRCTFRRRRTGEPVDLRGALFCETTDGLVSEMRMYHHRRVRESR